MTTDEQRKMERRIEDAGGYARSKCLDSQLAEDDTFRILHSMGFNMVATAFSDHEYRMKWIRENKPELIEQSKPTK